MRTTTFSTALAAFTSIFFFACNADATGDGRRATDISDVKIDLKIERFDQALFSMDTNQIEAGTASLMQKWPEFTPFFAKNIIGDPRNTKETAAESIAFFIKSPEMRALNDSVKIAFTDFSTAEKSIETVFRRFKKDFPEHPVPRVLTVETGYAYGVFPASDSVFCIGLDFFLGKNHPAYSKILEMPEYIRTRLDRKYMASQVAEALATDLVGPVEGQRFLDHIITNGKIFYLKEGFVPEEPDSVKWGFSNLQMQALRANEAELWAYILDKKLAYSTRWDDFKKLVSESPNAGDSPPALREFPGRAANWIGYRIVSNYMKKTDASMEELLKTRDPQVILEKARYKPRKK